ncbi:hypothetical protein NQZ68_013956 [Dissostichus eleginoides]|nr:hypothetical protein NQZ68_013956 [Dissostichus eleginoides]
MEEESPYLHSQGSLPGWSFSPAPETRLLSRVRPPPCSALSKDFTLLLLLFSSHRINFKADFTIIYSSLVYVFTPRDAVRGKQLKLSRNAEVFTG